MLKGEQEDEEGNNSSVMLIIDQVSVSFKYQCASKEGCVGCFRVVTALLEAF